MVTSMALDNPSINQQRPIAGEVRQFLIAGIAGQWTDEYGSLWLVLNGQIIGRPNWPGFSGDARYQRLYQRLWGIPAISSLQTRGVSWGSDWDNGNALRLPDARGHVLSNASAQLALGTRTGANQAYIPIEALPEHDHVGSMGLSPDHVHDGWAMTSGEHAHQYWVDAGSSVGASGNQTYVFQGGSPGWTTTNGSHWHTIQLSGSGTHQHSLTIGKTGAGSTMSLMQSTLVVQHMIATGA